MIVGYGTDGYHIWNSKISIKNVLGDLVRGLPLLKYDKYHLCAACELGKQNRKSRSFIMNTKIIEPLKLLHIDMCGPYSIEIIGSNKYIFFIVDDFIDLHGFIFLSKNLKPLRRWLNLWNKLSYNYESRWERISMIMGLNLKNKFLRNFWQTK